MNKLLEKKLHDARLNILIQDPFIGYIMQHLEINIDKDVPTAHTNGKSITFGKAFLEGLSLDDTIFVLIHELLHVILFHPLRMKGKELNRFNIACDIVVNEIVNRYNYRTEKITPVTGNIFNIYAYNHTAEEVYDMLEGNDKIKDFEVNHNWNIGGMDGYQYIKRIMNKAHKKGISTKNFYLLNNISQIIDNRSNNNWEKILEQYIEKSIMDFSYQKIDYRYSDILLPSYTNSENILSSIWFLIDVSSSISNEELSRIASELYKISSIYNSVDCSLSFFSTTTTQPIKLNNKKNIVDIFNKSKVGGGTNFIQIFDYINTYFKFNKPNLVIIFTDGQSVFPKIDQVHHLDLIWCMTEDITSPIGKTIKINC